MSLRVQHWVGGKPLAPSSADWLQRHNPATGELVADVARGTPSDVDRAAEEAEGAKRGWRRLRPAERGRLLNVLAAEIRERHEELADLEIADSGKPRGLALGEVEGSAAYFEYYASLVNLPLGDTLDVDPDQHVFTHREPYGVVGVITPWNLPLNQAARACAPALAAGNTVVAKPAEATSQSTVRLAQLATEVGFPDGVFNVVLGNGAEVGEAIVRHPHVRKVAFTGSVAVGQTLGHVAADRIIPLSLELGGKSANIVFSDADLDLAAREAVRGFTANSGQVCSAGTRLLVQRDIYDELVDTVCELAGKISADNDLGPMITENQYQQVKRCFDEARDEGLTPVLGGRTAGTDIPHGGYFIEPTVYKDVDNSMHIAQKEIFGPVLVAIAFDTETDAVRIANDSQYGLVGGIWSRDVSRALRVAGEIEAGQVFVNTWSTGAVETPFGGHKHSGYGREKGIEALDHYTHLKCVIVALEQPQR